MVSMTMPDLLERIRERLVTPRPDCLLWPDAVDRGYGRIYVDGTAQRVHRVLWELEHGPIPEGLTIDHLCRVRSCCNTAHMELVTIQENLRRAAPYRPDRRLVQPGACRNGHEYTADNTAWTTKGWRRCRVCRRAKLDRRNATRRAARKEAGARPTPTEASW